VLEYLLLVAAVLTAAFYSGSETGFYCMNRLRLWVRAEQGVAAARALQRLVTRPRDAISTMLVGTNIGVYVATVLCTGKLSETVLGARADLYSSLIMPPILLIFAEIIPKSLFQHHADALMYGSVWPLRVSEVVFYPLASLLRRVSALPQLLLGQRGAPQQPAVTQETFRFYLSQGAAHGVLSSYQRRMAENILHLKSVQVATASTPLERAVMVPQDASWSEVRDVLKAHRYSRLPVYGDGRENIVGVINVIDMAGADEVSSPRELVRDVLSLRHDTSVADALNLFRDAKQQLGVVCDDAGRAIGLVTVKDLVEEIVGELEAW